MGIVINVKNTLVLLWNCCCILHVFCMKSVSEEDLLNFEQDDPQLIEIIKNEYLLPPPPKKFAMPKHMLRLQGQEGQPIKVNDEIFRNKLKTGFYIEAGAYDGEQWSNSLFYEVEKKWDGLLVEAHPDAFARMKKRKRKSWKLGNCLSTKTTPEIVEFDAAGLLGGIIHENRKPGGTEEKIDLSKKLGNVKVEGLSFLGDEYERRTVKSLCFPLYSVLLALGNPTVHYLSLDVEGSEFPILKTIPFEKVDIKVIDVEVNHAGTIFPGSFEEIDNYLKSQGYKLHSIIANQDAIYVKKGFTDEINEL